MQKIKKYFVPFIFFISIFFFFLRPMSPDGDVYHHLSTGKYIVQNLRVPYADEWTFTAPGKPWIAHSWAGAILMYLAFSQGGPLGLSLLFAMSALVTFILLYLTIKRLFPLMIIAPILATRWPTRPESFQYMFIAALFLTQSLQKKNARFVCLFPLIILLWANVYGASIILGLTLVIFFAWRRSPLIVVLSCIIALTNPNTYHTVLYPFLLRDIAPYQGEWAGLLELIKIAPVEILNTIQYHILMYLLFAVFTISLIASSWHKFLQHKKELLLSVALLLPFIAFRFLPYAVILSVPALGIALSTARRTIRIFGVIVGIVVLSISLWLQLPMFSITKNPFPEEIVTFLKQNNLSGKIFANQRLGSFLEYYLAGQSTVYQDTRDDLYLSTGTIREYFTIFSQRKSVIPILEKYGVDVVAADAAGEGPSYRPLLYRPDWTLVYISDRFLVIVRSTLAQARHLPCLCTIDPYTPSGTKNGKENSNGSSGVQ